MSDLKIEMKKADFLNEQQKQLKQKIMEELIATMNNNISGNIQILDDQSIADIILSCLIMFTRDTLVHFFVFSNSIFIRGKIMNQVFDEIKKGVQERIKERMN